MNQELTPFTSPPLPPEIEPDMRVGFILSPHFTLTPFAAFIDCLRHAADEADFSRQVYCHWKIVAPTMAPVKASCGVEVCPHELLSEDTAFDYLVVIGGLLPGSMDHPEQTLGYLRHAYEHNTSIVGLCTASFVLAKAGLLEDRRCALHFEHINQFKQLFPRTLPEADQILVNDGEIITSPGGASAIDVALALIETCCGRARAVKAVTSLLLDRRHAMHHMPHRPYSHLAACGNRHVERAVSLVERHLSKPHSMRELARRLNISVRELNRAFSKHAGDTPAALSRKIRLTHGHWLLVNSTRTVTQIADDCGFADAAHFCRWFKCVYGETPTRFRKRRCQV